MSAICDAHKKKVGVELLYNSVKTGSQAVWRPDQLETRCGRESQHPAEGALRPLINQFGDQTSWREDAGMRKCPGEAGPPDPLLSSPRRTRKKHCSGHRSWGSICCSSVRSPTPSHTQPFQIM